MSGKMRLTFWEKFWILGRRVAVRRSRPNLQPIRDLVSNHNMPETCHLIAAEQGAPAGAEALIAAEMAALRARANDVRRKGKTHQLTRSIVTVYATLFLVLVPSSIRRVIRNIKPGEPWLPALVHEFAFFLLIPLFAYLTVGFSRGEVSLWKRLCFDWAERLGGKAGLDGLDDVAEWLQTRWGWFLPPNLAKNDVIWAAGTRRGVPVLAVIDHPMATIMIQLLARSTWGRRSGGVDDLDQWSRTNVFVHGARFRDEAHRDRIKSRLRQIGGGAVQCPNGVYLYAAYFCLGFYREAGPTSEIWVDFVDQVIDPEFKGSPSAMRELLEELRFVGLLPSKDNPHA